ncbi:tripartite tricarboxylate transporter permease [Chelativorans sp. SCAU2101]|uniref:Tripartite tricarboxylate transporter permease n=1 Tax=Chelativorans petroleitrophicus TaxID=2975484 RepID=A0A9X2X4W3_9HYPH|nr:tripartite tricarboxylate transporter permease [Chelativorans petroleitrophicus]MCT8989052.1 tripartite tricarboxylate transporter permease [Chelativorans petroleitrophicus]
MLNDLLLNLALGLSTALTVENLIYCAIGVTLGMVVGVLPGLGTLATMSMLFPITFYLEPTTAIIMLAGIWYGSSYGGSTAAILLNLPGTPSSAVVCLDGYPMARQGRAGVALFMTTAGSFFGASVGIVLMMLFSQPLVKVALSFGPAEYFSFMIVGLIAACVISDGSAIKGIAMVMVGILLGVVGLDVQTGQARFIFGIVELVDGISLVALAMGFFGIAEVMWSVRQAAVTDIGRVSLRSMMPTREDIRRSWMPMIRASGIGSFFGIMPGVGPSVSSFLSYALEKKVSREPERFGKGAIEGVVAPETANNASDQASFIPTMVLGIPGSATMALILGLLIIHGITPGPAMMAERPDLFWGVVMSFWIGNILLVLLNIPMIGIWVRLLTIPYHVLYPAIVVFICIGVYSVSGSTFDVFLTLLFGLVGYGARLMGFPAAPLLLGFVLGPMMEQQFRRAMLLSRGSLDIFVTRPVSAAFVLLAAALLLWSLWNVYRARRAVVSEQPS